MYSKKPGSVVLDPESKAGRLERRKEYLAPTHMATPIGAGTSRIIIL